jgi:hypothetical protein
VTADDGLSVNVAKNVPGGVAKPGSDYKNGRARRCEGDYIIYWSMGNMSSPNKTVLKY